MFARTIAVDGFGELNPGSFLEVTKILPLLTAVSADHPSSHVVAPKQKSLPGFMWLDGVLEKGFHADHFTELFNKLLISLGYSEYVTQGGDGPCHVTRLASVKIPSLLKYLVIHGARAAVCRTYRELPAEQSTKPQALGFSLADPPVGLFAWKLVTWADAYPRTDDEGRTRVRTSIRFLLRARARGPSGLFHRKRKRRPDWWRLPGPPIRGQEHNLAPFPNLATFPKTTVPVGLSYFPKDLVQFDSGLMTSWLRAQGKVVFVSAHEVGGHLAYEQPSAFVCDLRKMFDKSGPAAGVVLGCAGY
ncbi:alpha/beta-hydrolase [Lactarius sanguifluus]|nr:alpha/beta-hydrolase [Lactarius sanguifluus]